MKRLTMPNDKGMCMHNGLVCCPDENCADGCLQKRMEKLWEYENAEEQGLLARMERQAMKRSRLCDYDKVNYSDGLRIWYEKETDELVCTVSLKEERGQVWICSLFVSPKYRHLGMCKVLLDYAVFNGGVRLRCRKENHAVEIYKKYGFIVYDADENFLYMMMEDKDD